MHCRGLSPGHQGASTLLERNKRHEDCTIDKGNAIFRVKVIHPSQNQTIMVLIIFLIFQKILLIIEALLIKLFKCQLYFSLVNFQVEVGPNIFFMFHAILAQFIYAF